ncbi:hypothetical protein A9W99_23615 [Mycobacterium sp. 1164966.3]|nr:hypothetical protein A9W99_23615 [Mycobacterium sp. 1164966.3]
MVRSYEDFETVKDLIATGLNDCAIARQTGIPRPTVRDWRCRPQVRRQTVSTSPCGIDHDFLRIPAKAYSYLLGLYLGDGCISRCRLVWHLRISLDKKYPDIVDRCRVAIDMVMPRQQASISPQPKGCVVVSHYSKHWPCLFPQHGPGRKHTRPIRLEPWQDMLVKHGTEAFIRGLIDSDGCRVLANDRGVLSVRYHFSNRSDDIRNLFCAALDELDIPWTRPSSYQIAVYRKAAVARLDEFVGPKS